ncbi:Phenylacetate-coenzyme A ligase [Variovorax boronicumulans]|uniref:phenylacetate--CoA ligase family protein n=1 Tax=Variovorax boronicumulans TaxID=436515 RepID=UPI000BB3504E|nr:AMP-binding protein [Variovorax boronicumulans]PBI87774.1 Phenylacetate-coenzyme A ligase [Variovorax boronicumulans]
MSANPGTTSFSAVETQPWETLQRDQEVLLRRQLNYLASHSDFYRAKMKAAGVDLAAVQTLEDLSGLPFTCKQELRESLGAAPLLGLHRAAPMSEIVQVQASSGTTGSPAYVGLTRSDRKAWSEVTARGLFACGVRPHDLVLHAFSMSKGFVGGVPIYQGVTRVSAIDIPIGADGGADRLLIAARDARPRCIVGTPNFLLYLASIASDVVGLPATQLGVERLIVGGEPGGGNPAIRSALEQAWGATCCELMGGTDLGCVYWAESDDQRGMYFVAPDHILVELIDPQSLALVPWTEGATGELVYTSLQRQASPVLRFRSGDHVTVTAMGGPGGRTTPAIRCFGRTDDMLIVRGVNIFPSAVQDIVSAMAPLVGGAVRVLADFEGHTTQGNLKLLVERAPGPDTQADAQAARQVEARIRNALSVKAEVHMVRYGFFAAPGAQKVALTLRQMPDING